MTEYERMCIISQGSYGVVYKAREMKTGKIVAVKVQAPNPSNSTEIEILKSLPRHPSIVPFKRAGTDNCGRTYIAMEYVENDLEQLIERRIPPFTPRDIKRVMRQLLEGVSFLHDRGVMHRDLKPSNVLITDKGALKICDFGLSTRFGAEEKAAPQGLCVGTMWYKAPEILLGKPAYSPAVDMWAVGCIMAELLLKDALFQESSEGCQLACIRATVGTSCGRLAVKLNSVMRLLTPQGLDLLERLLAYDPKMRITAKEALNHSWFRENYCGLPIGVFSHKIINIYSWCY